MFLSPGSRANRRMRGAGVGPLASSFLSGAIGMVNGTITASVASNILTISVKALSGGDPSPNNPVMFVFRDVTTATGDYVVVPSTSALSVNTSATGATLGTGNAVPFRLWVTVFNNGGTLALALWQSVTGGSTPIAQAALNESSTQTTTAMSGSATAAGTFYSQSAISAAKSFRIIGYVEYASGLTTAGTYSTVPTQIQLFGPGVKKPGDIVQTVYLASATNTATTSSTPQSTAITLSITPTSAANLVRASAGGTVKNNNPVTTGALVRLFRGSTALSFHVDNYINLAGANLNLYTPAYLDALDAPGTTSATTYVVKLSNQDNASEVDFAVDGGQILAQEIMS